MKSKYFIESVEADGPKVEKSIIKFTKGFNIITGKSDTGKTSMVRSILYIFNKSWLSNRNTRETKFPFSKQFGYDQITVSFKSDEGRIAITRKVDSTKVEVDSSVSEIDSGTYSINSNTVAKNLNDILLQIIGISERHQVPNNKSFKTQRLTWNTLANLWYIDEDTVTSSDPKILPNQSTAVTGFKSALNFMITGEEVKIPEKITDPKVQKARSEARKMQLKDQIKNSSQKIKQVEEKIKYLNITDVDANLGEVLSKIEKLSETITERMTKSNLLQHEISEINQQIEEMEVYISRYKNLKTEYIADIKRLNFIVNGERELNLIPQDQECPFCHQHIEPEETHNHVEAAKAELSRILVQVNSLESSTQDVVDKRQRLYEKREIRQIALNSIREELSAELKPELQNLKQQQEKYQNYIGLSSQVELYKNLTSEWNESITEIEKDDTKHLEYRPLDHFPDTFFSNLGNDAKSILEKCNYPNLVSVRFDRDAFEIEINGSLKDETHGKGFRAFLNTVVNLSFRKYLFERGAYTTGIDIIDTPFLGLDLGEAENIPHSLKEGLIDYLAGSQEYGQVIMVENRKDIPNIDLEKKGINVIEFTDGQEGRQGFLLDFNNEH